VEPAGTTTLPGSSTSSYDADRRLTAVVSPLTGSAQGPLTTVFSYDPDGRLLQTQQSAGGTVLRTTASAYTPTGKVSTTTDANGNVTSYAYDPVDRLSSLADAMGRVTSYAYDALSRRTQNLQHSDPGIAARAARLHPGRAAGEPERRQQQRHRLRL
jgi:YD repeat-containing protein